MDKLKGVISLTKEFLSFIWQRKLWWLLPIIIIFLLLSGLIFLTEGTAVAPFIYTIF